MKEVNTIYETKDFSMFSNIKGNRKLKQSHIDYFVKELKENGQQTPFIVWDTLRNNKLVNLILDGQHRFEACKILNIPFTFFYPQKQRNTYFQTSKDGSIADVVTGAVNRPINMSRIKNIQKGLIWSIQDHLNFFITIQNPTYIKLKELADRHNVFTLHTIVTLIGSTESFKEGNLKTDRFDSAEKILNAAKQLKDWYKFYNRSTFVIALASLAANKKFNLDYFLEKCETYSNLLLGCNGRDAYKDMLINLYNFRRKDKIDFNENRYTKSKAKQKQS